MMSAFYLHELSDGKIFVGFGYGNLFATDTGVSVCKYARGECRLHGGASRFCAVKAGLVSKGKSPVISNRDRNCTNW